jgi:hypothetical protein
MDKKKKAGGARAGAGRGLIYGEKTEQLKISVPISKKATIEKMILKFLKPFRSDYKP